MRDAQKNRRKSFGKLVLKLIFAVLILINNFLTRFSSEIQLKTVSKQGKVEILTLNAFSSMAKNEKLYETTVIFDGNLDDENTQSAIEKVKQLITSLGGNIKNITDNGRRKLAYKIGKHTIGYYIHIEFTAPPTMLAELERQYRLNEQIIRFLTIILDKPLLEIRERVAKYGTAQPSTESKPETAQA